MKNLVLGKLPPSPNSNANPKPNPDLTGGQFSSGAIFRTPKNLHLLFHSLSNYTLRFLVANQLKGYNTLCDQILRGLTL